MNKIAAAVTIVLALLGGPAKDFLGSELFSSDMLKYRSLEARTYLANVSDAVAATFAKPSR